MIEYLGPRQTGFFSNPLYVVVFYFSPHQFRGEVSGQMGWSWASKLRTLRGKVVVTPLSVRHASDTLLDHVKVWGLGPPYLCMYV